MRQLDIVWTVAITVLAANDQDTNFTAMMAPLCVSRNWPSHKFAIFVARRDTSRNVVGAIGAKLAELMGRDTISLDTLSNVVVSITFARPVEIWGTILIVVVPS